MRRGAGWGVLPVLHFMYFLCGARAACVFFPQLAGCFDSDESRDINLRPTHPGRAALHPHRTLRATANARKGCSLGSQRTHKHLIHLFAAGATNFSLRLSCVFSCLSLLRERERESEGNERASARVAFPARDFKGPAAKLKTNPINEAAAVCQQQKNATQLAALSLADAAMFVLCCCGDYYKTREFVFASVCFALSCMAQKRVDGRECPRARFAETGSADAEFVLLICHGENSIRSFLRNSKDADILSWSGCLKNRCFLVEFALC